MVRVPTIIVRHHGDARVSKLRLSNELGLGHVGHPDDVAVPRPVKL